MPSGLPWNYLWRPGEYSKKDHDKIAEKYHLHPKEYKPYPESDSQYVGDYPKLPKIGPAVKDPYYPYDIPVYRKNYHETVSLCAQGTSAVYHVFSHGSIFSLLATRRV